MKTRSQIWAIALVVIGVLMIFGSSTNLITIAALFILIYGVYKIRQGTEVRTGYVLLAVGSGIILLDHLVLVLIICLISLALFYAKAKRMHPRLNEVQKHDFIAGLHWDRDPWMLQNTGMWHVFGELDVDLTLAIAGENDNSLIFQGIIGDLDLVLSDDFGVEIEAFVLFGRIQFGREQDTGMVNRMIWRSPNYELSERKVRIVVSYLIGDVNIKVNY